MVELGEAADEPTLQGRKGGARRLLASVETQKFPGYRTSQITEAAATHRATNADTDLRTCLDQHSPVYRHVDFAAR
jgi:hypothetical protein